MDLGKLYINPQYKFGARHYEVLQNKHIIFFEKCQIAGLGEACSKMLSPQCYEMPRTTINLGISLRILKI